MKESEQMTEDVTNLLLLCAQNKQILRKLHIELGNILPNSGDRLAKEHNVHNKLVHLVSTGKL